MWTLDRLLDKNISVNAAYWKKNKKEMIASYILSGYSEEESEQKANNVLEIVVGGYNNHITFPDKVIPNT